MKHTDNSVRPGLRHHRARVILRVARVNDNGHFQLPRQRKLLGESAPLLAPRRIVVVVIETAFSERYGALSDKISQPGNVSRRKAFSVVRMDASREPDEARIFCCDGCRCTSGAEDIPGAAAGTDAHNGVGPAVPCASNYLAAVTGERFVCEVRVTVDEPFDIPSFRGHCLSIQRRTGPAM